MSNQRLYCLFDKTAETVIGQTVAFPRDAAAVRHFTELLANKEVIIGQYPADFQLIYVGLINTTVPMIEGDKPQIIYTGAKWLLDQQKLVDDETAAHYAHSADTTPGRTPTTAARSATATTAEPSNQAASSIRIAQEAAK